jgi:hypothetical protein
MMTAVLGWLLVGVLTWRFYAYRGGVEARITRLESLGGIAESPNNARSRPAVLASIRSALPNVSRVRRGH